MCAAAGPAGLGDLVGKVGNCGRRDNELPSRTGCWYVDTSDDRHGAALREPDMRAALKLPLDSVICVYAPR